MHAIFFHIGTIMVCGIQMFSISTFDQANNSLDLNNKITQMFDGEDDDKEHPLQMYHVDSKYLNTEDLTDNNLLDNKPKFSAMHINIHSLPAKSDQLRTLVSMLDQNIRPNFILLCETWLSSKNCSTCEIPGYSFIII